MFEKLTENRHRFHDTCDVYLIKDGSHALAIDFGDGRRLDPLGEIGVSQLDRILHSPITTGTNAKGIERLMTRGFRLGSCSALSS